MTLSDLSPCEAKSWTCSVTDHIECQRKRDIDDITPSDAEPKLSGAENDLIRRLMEDISMTVGGVE